MRHVLQWRIPGGWASPRRFLREELRVWWVIVGALARWMGSRVNVQLGQTSLVLALIALALGLLLTAQLRSEPRRVADTPESRREAAVATIEHLGQEQAELKKTIAELRARVAAQQQLAANEKTTLGDISQELERQKILAGTVSLKGRGVKVVLDDSAATKIPADQDPSLYIVHEYQLRDVLNLLWLAGAEAISLNGERIIATTSIYCVGSTILVNDTRLSPPYELLAIGDPDALENAINDPANLQTLKARAKSYGIQFSVSRSNQLVVPAYTGSLDVKHAVVAAKEEKAGPDQQQRSRASEK